MMELHMLNPRKRRKKNEQIGLFDAPQEKPAEAPRAKAKSKKKKAKRKTMAKPRKSKARAHKGGKKKGGHRRKRGHVTTTTTKTTRRSNPKFALPSGGGGILKMLGAAALGIVGVSLVANRLPGTQEPGAIGKKWSMVQYAGAAAASLAVPIIARKIGLNPQLAQTAGLSLLASKAIFDELTPRVPMLQRALGEAEGDIKTDPATGQAMVYEGGRWQALQGLVPAGPLGEDYGEDNLQGLVPAGPMGADVSLMRAYS
jgi:hypothetical protein